MRIAVALFLVGAFLRPATPANATNNAPIIIAPGRSLQEVDACANAIAAQPDYCDLIVLMSARRPQ